MTRLDRYITKQLLLQFAVFTLILMMVYWINRAVVLFDQLIANGHSALVFLEFTSLNLPNVIRIVIPMAGFVASVWAFNRLNSENELVAIQSVGTSPWRLSRPVIMFGLSLFVLLTILVHWLAPLTHARLTVRESEIATDLTARLLREGVFMHPDAGVTFFVGEITNDGLLLDLFLEDGRTPNETTTYTARRAIFLRSETGGQLVMLDGLAQRLDHRTGSLSTTQFADLLFDISDLISRERQLSFTARSLNTWQLITETAPFGAKIKSSAYQMQVEFHERFAQTIFAPVAAMIGFAALITGSFSRFGLWRQIALAVFLIVCVKGMDNLGIAQARANTNMAHLVYWGPVIGTAVAVLLLQSAARNRRRSRATA